MLKECRQALKINTDKFDTDLCDLMTAGALDLKIAGVVIPGTVSFRLVTTTVGTETTEYWQDDSTLTDALVRRAIFTYTDSLFFKDSEHQARMREMYEIQKNQLMHASDYTDYNGGDSA